MNFRCRGLVWHKHQTINHLSQSCIGNTYDSGIIHCVMDLGKAPVLFAVFILVYLQSPSYSPHPYPNEATILRYLTWSFICMCSYLYIYIFQFCGCVLLFHINGAMLLNTMFKDLCLWLCISSPLYLTVGEYPMEYVQHSSILPRVKSRFPSDLYNHKPGCNGPVDPLPMELCKNFSGACTQEEDAGSYILDRFIHNLMKYCRVTLKKAMMLSRASHSFVGWIKWFFSLQA